MFFREVRFENELFFLFGNLGQKFVLKTNFYFFFREFYFFREVCFEHELLFVGNLI